MTPPITGEDLMRKRTPADFVFGKVIGEGSYSTVYLARDVQSSREFAIKVLEKRHIIRERKTEYVTREKQILQLIGNTCKYFVHLFFTFQDTDRLYFVLTYAKNGELLNQINKSTSLTLHQARYYTCELVLALEYLKARGIAHRDLKPENVLFDEHWHILITDFGSAKIMTNHSSVGGGLENKDTGVGRGVGVGVPVRNVVDDEDEDDKRRKYSFVGTAQYVSPEILNDTSSSCASDLWALGCIVYQMVAGQMPFRGASDYLIFQKIMKLDYDFPLGFDRSAKDFVQRLIVLAPGNRLGANDEVPYTSLRNHKFFKDMNWDNLGEPPGSFSPSVEGVTIPDYLEPGLDEQKATRLHFELLSPATAPPPPPPVVRKKSESNRRIVDMGQEEVQERLETQKGNIYNDLVEGNLILKSGIVEKRKGLFPRRRMLLLTLGPHLYYIDPATMILKGEIPWSEDLKTEAKNFKKFFVHTPNRIYYLEDPDGYALEWCKAIDEVKSFYYPG